MTSARSQLVDPTTPGYYHCVSRCVRRAWLCGVDEYTGESFEYRRQWVEERIIELGAVFALGVYAYAVMSNHLHVVLRVDPALACSWSPDEVARRWTALFPVRVAGEIDDEATTRRAQVIAGDAERTTRYRERLSSLSWFMRCLNQSNTRTPKILLRELRAASRLAQAMLSRGEAGREGSVATPHRHHCCAKWHVRGRSGQRVGSASDSQRCC